MAPLEDAVHSSIIFLNHEAKFDLNIMPNYDVVYQKRSFSEALYQIGANKMP